MASSLRVAIIGSGPSAMYAADDINKETHGNVTIDFFERLPTPFGMIRSAVAPDHPEKKRIVDTLFARFLDRANTRFFGNVGLGKDISLDELREHYHAVVLGIGAQEGNCLSIPGEDLPGCWSSWDFASWYNGHPEFSELPINLETNRAVIIGTGNVAMDVARILCLSEPELYKSDIADHALQVLRRSHLEEIVILGRRGAEHAAFLNPELEELGMLGGVDIAVEPYELPEISSFSSDLEGWNKRRKIQKLETFSRRPPRGGRRISFKFNKRPYVLTGNGHVECLEIMDTVDGALSEMSAGLVVKCIGYRGKPIAGLPFDDRRGIIPNTQGRVNNLAGVYVTGWAKRGPEGIIGTNKKCARETIRCLLADHDAGRLTRSEESGDIVEYLTGKGVIYLTEHHWDVINATELQSGVEAKRSRCKITNMDELLAYAS